MKNKLIPHTTVDITPINQVTTVFKTAVKSRFDFIVLYFRLNFIKDYNPNLYQKSQKKGWGSTDNGKLSADGRIPSFAYD